MKTGVEFMKPPLMVFLRQRRVEELFIISQRHNSTSHDRIWQPNLNRMLLRIFLCWIWCGQDFFGTLPPTRFLFNKRCLVAQAASDKKKTMFLIILIEFMLYNAAIRITSILVIVIIINITLQLFTSILTLCGHMLNRSSCPTGC